MSLEYATQTPALAMPGRAVSFVVAFTGCLGLKQAMSKVTVGGVAGRA
jgi:hypothetical protein